MEVFAPQYMRPQNPQVISLIEGNYDQAPAQSYPQRLQTQMPTTLPINLGRVDYVPIIAIVGLIGLFGIIALLAYLKR